MILVGVILEQIGNRTKLSLQTSIKWLKMVLGLYLDVEVKLIYVISYAFKSYFKVSTN